MSCFWGAILVAFVDRVGGGWATVELSESEWVEVRLSRLPRGADEGDSVCYCRALRYTSPRVFRSCPDVL